MVRPTVLRAAHGARGGAGDLLCSPGARSYLHRQPGAVSALPQRAEDPQTSMQMPGLSPLGLPPLLCALHM